MADRIPRREPVWRDLPWPVECDLCDASAEVWTASTSEPPALGDGDPVRCVGCGATSHVVVDEGDDGEPVGSLGEWEPADEVSDVG